MLGYENSVDGYNYVKLNRKIETGDKMDVPIEKGK